MINKHYQRYYTRQLAPSNNQRPNSPLNINQQNNNKNSSQSFQNQAPNISGYTSNSGSIYQNQDIHRGYSDSTGIYDVGTMMYVKTHNNSHQYQNSFDNNNQNMYRNNMNNQNYQQMNNSGQNMQQNYYNQNSQNMQQNNYIPNTQRNNYSNIQQQFMNNNQNINQNNNNLNTQRNYNPNMNYYNNNQNYYPNAQRSHFIAMPQNMQNLQDIGSPRHRRYTQNQRVYNNNNISHFNQMNNNNFLNSQMPNQYNNSNYNNQQFNQNQNKNINQQNPQVQKLANDMENKLNIEEKTHNSQQNLVNKNNPNSEQNQEEKEPKDTNNEFIEIEDDRIKYLEDDNFMSVTESIHIEKEDNKKKNKVVKFNDKKEENKPKKTEKKEESKLIPLLSKYITKTSKEIKRNNTKDDNTDKNDNNSEDEEDNQKDIFPLNYTKTVYTIDEDHPKNNNNDNNNSKDEEKKVGEGNGLNFDNLDNDSFFPGLSVLDSVQIADELPNEIHNHPLSNEPIKNEKCTICNQEKSCDKGYKCHKCPLIICDQCSNTIRINFYSHFKHEHSLCLINEGNMECNKCKQQTNFITFFFNCEQCKFNICLNCYTPDRKKEDNILHEHPLKYFNESKSIKCKICDKGSKSGYKCNNCKIELCQECANNIYSHHKRYELHNHPLYLTFRDKWNCFICQCGFKNTISFCCKKCSLDYCVDCFLE